MCSKGSVGIVDENHRESTEWYLVPHTAVLTAMVSLNTRWWAVNLQGVEVNVNDIHALKTY